MNFIDIAHETAKRREHLCKNAKPCPACNSNQVQLVDWSVVPSEWKCRECKHLYAYEPVPS